MWEKDIKEKKWKNNEYYLFREYETNISVGEISTFHHTFDFKHPAKIRVNFKVFYPEIVRDEMPDIFRGASIPRYYTIDEARNTYSIIVELMFLQMRRDDSSYDPFKDRQMMKSRWPTDIFKYRDVLVNVESIFEDGRWHIIAIDNQDLRTLRPLTATLDFDTSVMPSKLFSHLKIGLEEWLLVNPIFGEFALLKGVESLYNLSLTEGLQFNISKMKGLFAKSFYTSSFLLHINKLIFQLSTVLKRSAAEIGIFDFNIKVSIRTHYYEAVKHVVVTKYFVTSKSVVT
ncbi:hypothetical protein SAMN05192574_11425 [Mucilaginibacter gossypiicola]|uniref:Uncharacterized protein n=1 Tax=Mucilaginibacter gossypiicola TaxID=551995 RepID=A0A1H8SYS3_9SPHI|nr:hypothetical protein [Mucilaginibacter gossypiicola]SEO83920.1 hypothetical protein SAMN05192574_11425 [Mucilaginibacter gossypiicola]